MARAGKGKKQKSVAVAVSGRPLNRRGRSRRSRKTPMQPRPGRAARKQPTSGGSSYAKLILDPCEAKLTSAPFPGRAGAQAMRIPFRTIVTVPTATTSLTGASQTGGQQCSALCASVFPHAMQSGSGAYACPIIIQAFPSESSGAGISSSTGGLNSINASIYPSGLGQLFGISSEIRPIAACIKMGYIGPQGSNAGSFVAFEGQASQLYAKMGSQGNPAGDAGYSMALAVPISNLALDGWTTCDTTKTVEARVNFAAADPYWQTLKPTSTPLAATGAYTRGVGLLDSTCLADPDLTGLPVGTVGVSGAVPGTQYLVTGAIVYEWVPSVTLGIPAVQRTLRDPKQLQTVVAQLGKYGRMLVGLAVDASNGTAPGLMLDLAMKAFSSLAIGRMSNSRVPRIGM